MGSSGKGVWGGRRGREMMIYYLEYWIIVIYVE
jgi:hypothetical protein